MDLPERPSSANEAFENNNITAVRAIEKQLRASVSRDKERLRGLVGGNYRDLLSTADSIVILDQRTKATEAQISDLSRQCKPPQQQTTQRTISIFSTVSARSRLLSQCITCASTAVQNRSVLLGAKLYVVSRLLLKSLANQESTPKSVENLQNKTTALRRQLLRLINSQLRHPASSIEILVHAVCSHCLVTSASSGDAVDHFRQLRLDKLRQRVENGDKDRVQIRENFQYLVGTVRMLKVLLGRPVNDALGALQKQPILQDQSVLMSSTLDVDRLQNLIPEDILTFTPYIKRVLLRQNEIQQFTTSWVQQACQVFAQGLGNILTTTDTIEGITTLRKDLLSVILPVYFSTNSRDILLETVRSTTSTRVLEICTAQAETLAELANKLISPQLDVVDHSTLWEPGFVQGSLNSTGTDYVKKVQAKHLGTNGELSRLIKKTRRWARQITNLHGQFQALESTRWRDMLEEPDDEDEDAAQEIIDHLSKEDPRKFRVAMEAAVREAVSRFDQVMRNVTAPLIEGTSEASEASSVSKIVHLLRVLRESAVALTVPIPGVAFKTRDLASKLHLALAEQVADQIVSSFDQEKALGCATPSLSNDLPSPGVIRLLRDTCLLMAEIGGTDIWSTAAISKLKGKLSAKLLDNESGNVKVQTDFDKHFVRAALRNVHHSDEVPNASEMEAKATAYWQRTKLLFGVLAQ